MEDKMAFKQIKERLSMLLWVMIASGMFLLSACSGGGNTSNDSKTNTGALAFQVVYHNVAGHRQPQAAAVIDCAGEGVATVAASVYDPGDAPLQNGGPWDCEAGQGTISSVPAGSGRTIVILGKDVDGNVLFRGAKSGIQVDADSENDAGTIDCYAFVPSLQAPADGAVVNTETIDLAWNAVPGATEYHVRLSESSNLNDSIIDETTATANFTAMSLSNGRTYYWRVIAGDAYSNTGIESQIWSFTINDLGPHGIMHLDYENDVGMYSAIAVEDGKIFIAYYDETNKKLKVARSLNDGHDWSLSTVGSDDDAGKGSSIALDGNNVFISTTINLSRMGISASNDNGDTWNTSTILPDHIRTSNADYDNFATSIAVDGQNIYITFLSSDVLCLHLLKSTYSANDWEILPIPPILDDPLDDPENGYYSSINEYNGTLYISHSGYTVADVYLARVPNDLSNPVRSLVDEIGVQGDKGYTTSAVRQVDDNIYIYVAYFDQSDGNSKLKFGRSVNGGVIFSSRTIDNSSAVVGKYPSMAIYGNTIFVAYYDEANGNLKIARSSDHGDTWDIDPVDNDTDNVGRFASLAVDGPKVYISYYDETNKNLKFAKSIDGGNTW
jgi:hypothetical protein